MKRKMKRQSKKRRPKGKREAVSVGLTPNQVDHALKHILTSTLALYVLGNSQKPTSVVIKDLMDLEVKAAHLVGLVMQLQVEKIHHSDLKSALAGVFSFIPFPARKPAQSFT